MTIHFDQIMKGKAFYGIIIVFSLLGFFIQLSGFSRAGGTISSGDTIYIRYPDNPVKFIPRNHEYHQTLTMKLFMSQALYDGKFKSKDNGKSELYLTCEQALDVIRRIDKLTLGIPKIIYLVGWQYNGHDSGYPAWFKGNDAIKRPGDKDALESIKWLMAEAVKFNTVVSLHINMLDAYEDSPLWNDYVSNGIIARNADGSLRACEWGYPVDYAQEWKTGFTRKRIDSLYALLPLDKAGTIHIDAFHTWPPKPVPDGKGGFRIDLTPGPVSFANGFTVKDETEAQKNIFRYWASKGVDVTSEGVSFLRETGFEGYQPMAWWFGGELKYYLKWPAWYYCGGQDNSDWGRLFGTSMHGEDIVKKDPEHLSGFSGDFCLKTVIWYYLNRLERKYAIDRKDFREAGFTENVKTTISGGHFTLTQSGRLLADDDNVFLPAGWLPGRKIIAYSKTGYNNRTWALPETWTGVFSVSLKSVTDAGLAFKGIAEVKGGSLSLSIEKNETILIEPVVSHNSDGPEKFSNTWQSAPSQIPDNNSVDAPLLGNGNVLVTAGYKNNGLRFYLSKNDFWRLVSQADNLSGPRSAGYLDINIEDKSFDGFSCDQQLADATTYIRVFNSHGDTIRAKTWVAATANLVFFEISLAGKPVRMNIALGAPQNRQALFAGGSDGDIQWYTRSFSDSVDIKTKVAVALKAPAGSENGITLKPGSNLMLVLGMESLFSSNDPLKYVLDRVKRIDLAEIKGLRQKHTGWWNDFWSKSYVFIDDSVLLKAWYQGLYTMASCSRDQNFPPGLFGWTTTDTPSWNGDYHLNYNFQAPFYSLCSSNHPELSVPQDAPLLDFLGRGEWYAGNVTHTRGILYPVGIGPSGIEVTRNFKVGGYQKPGDIECGGLFYGQKSNASYGLVNMAQYWRCTRDTTYARKIYPYALDVVEFWEDYLKYEKGRYVIYHDAIHEGSGADVNPVLSLGLIRNAFDLITDLSSALNINGERQAHWKDMIAKLSSFPVQKREGKKVFRYTEKGLAWVDGNGLGIQHIYPGNAITIDSDPELLAIAGNTIDVMQRWHDMNTSNSFFVAAIRVGYDPVKVLRELHVYALNTKPNGFQKDNPHGIENSCTVTNALNEMFCMSAGNVLRIFADFPRDINAEFRDLRAWGAFLVSAELHDGIISGVRVFSEKGLPCTIINPWPGKHVRLIRNGIPSGEVSGERITFSTLKGEQTELVQM